jgi:hypothetical protein
MLVVVASAHVNTALPHARADTAYAPRALPSQRHRCRHRRSSSTESLTPATTLATDTPVPIQLLRQRIALLAGELEAEITVIEAPPLGGILFAGRQVHGAPLDGRGDAADAAGRRAPHLSALHADAAVLVELLADGVGVLFGKLEAEVAHGEGPFLLRVWGGDGLVDIAAVGGVCEGLAAGGGWSGVGVVSGLEVGDVAVVDAFGGVGVVGYKVVRFVLRVPVWTVLGLALLMVVMMMLWDGFVTRSDV